MSQTQSESKVDHRQMSTEDLEKFGYINIDERKKRKDGTIYYRFWDKKLSGRPGIGYDRPDGSRYRINADQSVLHLKSNGSVQFDEPTAGSEKPKPKRTTKAKTTKAKTTKTGKKRSTAGVTKKAAPRPAPRFDVAYLFPICDCCDRFY